MKCLEVPLTKGKMIYIPAYWWYSIKFVNSNSTISCFRYRTYVNNLAISPYIFMHMLQLQNIKRDVTKKISIDALNNQKNDNADSQIVTQDVNNNHDGNSTSNVINSTTNIDTVNNSTTTIESLSYPKPIIENENLGAEIKF
jgi:hypothetical protein